MNLLDLLHQLRLHCSPTAKRRYAERCWSASAPLPEQSMADELAALAADAGRLRALHQQRQIIWTAQLGYYTARNESLFATCEKLQAENLQLQAENLHLNRLVLSLVTGSVAKQ